jgi:hypothetical protein
VGAGSQTVKKSTTAPRTVSVMTYSISDQKRLPRCSYWAIRVVVMEMVSSIVPHLTIVLYISCFHLIKHIETTSRDSVIWPKECSAIRLTAKHREMWQRLSRGCSAVLGQNIFILFLAC